MVGNRQHHYALWPQAVGQWSIVGSAGFLDTASFSLKLHPITGAPYLAYADGAANRKAAVVTFSNNAWMNVGLAGSSTATVTDISLALNRTTGVPYVLYNDGDPGAQHTGNLGRATMMAYTNNAWSPVGSSTGFSAAAVAFVTMALHPNTGVPYEAYTDQGCSDQATVMTFDGSNNWLAVGSVGFSAGPAYNICLALHPTTGAPYVAYRDYGSGMNGGATVMTFT